MSAATAVEDPPKVETTMATGPGDSAGEVAVQTVVDMHETAVAATRPNMTVVAPAMKPVPVMVTLVPP